MQSNRTCNKVMTALKNPVLVQPHQLANLAFEIVKLKNRISNADFLSIYQLFRVKIAENNQQEILSNRMNYATCIMDYDVIIYEELVKLYSVLQECYALKTLGLKTQNDLSEFYEAVQKTYKKYDKTLNDIERRFYADFLANFDYCSNFLGE